MSAAEPHCVRPLMADARLSPSQLLRLKISSAAEPASIAAIEYTSAIRPMGATLIAEAWAPAASRLSTRRRARWAWSQAQIDGA